MAGARCGVGLGQVQIAGARCDFGRCGYAPLTCPSQDDTSLILMYTCLGDVAPLGFHVLGVRDVAPLGCIYV